jgi:hypothetical protein
MAVEGSVTNLERIAFRAAPVNKLKKKITNNFTGNSLSGDFISFDSGFCGLGL